MLTTPAASAGISEDDVASHRKRLGQILRYIASMQSTANESHEFVRSSKTATPYFQNHGSVDDDFGTQSKLIFTTFDFQRLSSLEQDVPTRPFSFYSATTSTSRKSKVKKKGSAPCWLRLTRPSTTETPPAVIDGAIRKYMEEWRTSAGNVPAARLLTVERIKKAPKSSNSKVNAFLQQYKKYLRRQEYQKTLEPIYNRLFEWLQDHNEDLIWGLGLAQIHQDGETVSGPLLEVRVEVELAKDGALLVRPREHTGISLNRDVLSALSTSGDNTARTLSQTVAEMDTCQISPGQPDTFVPLLKRMAVELSSGGKFVSAPKLPTDSLPQAQGLVVSDAFCLYSNPKPSAVWARDALKFAEELSDPDAVAPRALWSLTHGAGMLDKFDRAAAEEARYKNSFFGKLFGAVAADGSAAAESTRPLFPLPTSASQNRIAELLLEENYPAVVCEGPPGTGKTHTIANIICAYLTQGKRVLVTSKGAPALSVLRDRLPPCVQDLCVDVSMSESAGMRQLQQTVERLANKVSWASTEREGKKCQALMEKIEELEQDMKDLDKKMSNIAEKKRKLVETSKGQEFLEGALSMINNVPWLMKTIASWDIERLIKFQKTICDLRFQQEEITQTVSGFATPPSDCLISLVASNAGGALSSVKQAMQGVFSRLPLLGPGLEKHRVDIRALASELRLNGVKPDAKRDWQAVLEVLQNDKAIDLFFNDFLKHICERELWPIDFFIERDNQTGRRKIRGVAADTLEKAVKLWGTSLELGVPNEIKTAVMSRDLDNRRSLVAKQLQELAVSLVDAKVVAELSKSFSAEAQSSLIQFSQIAGKAKFGSSAQPSKMTARQRRRRQEYLNSFAKCVKFIPCWILTSPQISDYLPATCCFDLVVLDESSQSDISILPGMLRAKQWLVVGDSKQVSPTESFVREDDIVKLQDALPQSPLEDSFLPGRSFFDLCAQAFPRGRVVLREHFRCAPELIKYSNDEFYNGALTPLRLPRSTERLKPSLIDVRVFGVKEGKCNERECDEIVKRIDAFVKSCPSSNPRSIGVISLVGDDQSRLIRGRLLDAIGPKAFKDHDILIGSPSTFQGAERDIVFLSMVCSPKRVPTQIQLMYAQRANVALSRARDRMVLVRSIGADHIVNDEDIKHSIISFFEKSAGGNEDDCETEDASAAGSSSMSSPYRDTIAKLLAEMLVGEGYVARSMGVVWDGAICVESRDGDARAAITVEGSGESKEEWLQHTRQQRSIERVGWRCLRIDALHLLADYFTVLETCHSFLSSAGVRPSKIARAAMEQIDVDVARPHLEGRMVIIEPQGDRAQASAIAVSSDDEVNGAGAGEFSSGSISPSSSAGEMLGNGEQATDYGMVVDPRSFLGVSSLAKRPRKRTKAPRKNSSSRSQQSSVFSEDESEGPVARGANAGKDNFSSKKLKSKPPEEINYLQSSDDDDDMVVEHKEASRLKRKFAPKKLAIDLASSSGEELEVQIEEIVKKRPQKKARVNRVVEMKELESDNESDIDQNKLEGSSSKHAIWKPKQILTKKPPKNERERSARNFDERFNFGKPTSKNSPLERSTSVPKSVSPKKSRPSVEKAIVQNPRATKKSRIVRKAAADRDSSSDESVHSSDDDFIASDSNDTDTEDEGVVVDPSGTKKDEATFDDAPVSKSGADIDSYESDTGENKAAAADAFETVEAQTPDEVELKVKKSKEPETKEDPPSDPPSGEDAAGTSLGSFFKRRRTRSTRRDGKWKPMKPAAEHDTDLPHETYLKEVEDEPLSPSATKRLSPTGSIEPPPTLKLISSSNDEVAKPDADGENGSERDENPGDKESPVNLLEDE